MPVQTYSRLHEMLQFVEYYRKKRSFVIKNFLITSACWLWLLVRYTNAVRFYVKEYGDGAPIISKTEMIATFKT